MQQGMGLQVGSQGAGKQINDRSMNELAMRQQADAGARGGTGGMLGGRGFFG